MAKAFSILLLALGATAAAHAASYLDTIPGPDDTGGMVMPLVSLDFNTQSVTVSMLQSNTVALYPLQQYKAWDRLPYVDSVFNPTLSNAPWYDLLDPTGQHLPFSTRVGFMFASANAGLIPSGAYLYIKAVEISDGLKLYDAGFWEDVWGQSGGIEQWSQVFGEGNFGGTILPSLDNVVAWGDNQSVKMWHPVALVPNAGLYSARFEFYLGDGQATPLEGWSTDSIELHWLATVPEPTTAAAMFGLMAVTAAATSALRRRKRVRAARG